MPARKQKKPVDAKSIYAGMNTELVYYGSRSGDKHGAHHVYKLRIVLQGVLDGPSQRAIRSRCGGSEYFLPTAVGLPHPLQQEKVTCQPDDSPWCWLSDPAMLPTGDLPTRLPSTRGNRPITAAQFYAAFMEAGSWDVAKEREAIGMPHPRGYSPPKPAAKPTVRPMGPDTEFDKLPLDLSRPLYLALYYGKADGCDYYLDCNKTWRLVRGNSIHDALTAARRDDITRCEENPVSKVVVVAVTQVTTLDMAAVYAARKRHNRAKHRRSKEEKERQLAAELLAKYPDIAQMPTAPSSQEQK